jgi:hypothetical protein
MLIKTGSKSEKRDAVYFAKDLINNIGEDAYPDADISTLNADAGSMIQSEPSSEFFASGNDKPIGLLGQGDIRENVAKYADSVSNPVKGMLLGWDNKALDIKSTTSEIGEDGKLITKVDIGSITSEVDQDGKPIERIDKYNELNNSGKSRIDAVVEFTATLIGGKGDKVVESFDGKDQYILADVFRIYKLAFDNNDLAAMQMLRLPNITGTDSISDETLKIETIKTKLLEESYKFREKFTNTTIAFKMEDPLRKAVSAFIGDYRPAPSDEEG